MSKRKQATTTVSTLPYLSDLKRQKTESKSEGQHTGCIIAKIASTILKEVEHRAFTTGVVDFVAQYAIPSQFEGKCTRVFRGHFGKVTNVSSIGGGKVVTGGSDGRSVAWDVDSGEVSHSIMMLGEIPSSGISSVGEGKVLVRTTNSYINLFDMGSKKLLFSIYDRHICALVAFPDQKRAAIAYTSGVEIWDFVSRDTVRVIKVSSFLSYRNWCLCVYAGGSRLVSGYGEQGGLCSWDVESGERIHTFMGHHCRINSVCVLEKENLLVSASNGDIRVWDLKTGKFLKILEGHTGCILSVASFGDGLRVVSGSADTTLRVWNVVTGKCTHVLKGHTDGVRQVCCLDNNQIVSVSDDKTARVWG